MSDVIEEHLSDSAIQYAAEYIGDDVDMAAIAVPPVPRDRVEEVVRECDDIDEEPIDSDITGHLYDLTDIAVAINHSSDPMLDGGVGDDEPYLVERESVAEIKIARGALFSAFNRELAACARRLGIDPETHDDLVAAIRDELDYTVAVSVEEEHVDISDVDLTEE